VLHITIWGIEAFAGGLSGDGTEFWVPCDSLGCDSMECGWYGSGYPRHLQNECHPPT